jgi:outer membrane protein TolC
MLFNDAVLGELQLRAQVSNLELQAALARIEQSRAELGITSALRFPRVGLGMDYAREAQSENGKFAALGASTSHGDFWQSGFDASWEIDLWGRVRRAREGAAATLEVALYDREAVRVALSSEVARAYLQLRGTQAQLEVARQNQIVADESPLVS